MGLQHSQYVCLNGHQKDYWGVPSTDESLGFCEKCGSKLINSCPECHTIIPGFEEIDGVLSFGPSEVPVPKYCGHCGKPYPWTRSSIEAANELIDISELSDSDKGSFKSSIPDLITETPKTKVATTKYKILVSKVGTAVASGLKEVIVGVASESVKRALWGI